MDPFRDRITMLRSPREGFEDQNVEGSVEEVAGVARQWSPNQVGRRHSVTRCPRVSSRTQRFGEPRVVEFAEPLKVHSDERATAQVACFVRASFYDSLCNARDHGAFGGSHIF